MNKENNCPNYEIDDWGICTYKKDYNVEDCDDNCLYSEENSEANDSLVQI